MKRADALAMIFKARGMQVAMTFGTQHAERQEFTTQEVLDVCGLEPMDEDQPLTPRHEMRITRE